MPRRQTIYLVAIVLTAVTASVLTAFWQNKPLLGLDLQGGVSVRLTATEPATEEMLDQAVEIIRKRVDALGVAEPEVSRTAEGVMVSLPGVDNQQRALDLVGTTAELRFRPVCDVLPLMPADLAREGVARPAPASCEPLLAGDLTASTGPLGVTLPEDDLADQFVVLGGRDSNQRYLLAPSVLTGDALEDANADMIEFEWQVAVALKAGPAGIDAFNEMAALCFVGAPTCPILPGFTNGRLALVLDGEVLTAPQIRAPEFQRDRILISGAFDKEEADVVALGLRYGALPIELEAENTQVVSATIGEDSLDAGIVAGLIGLAIVGLFIVGYYRLLGLVALASLAISGSLLWAIIAHLGTQSGLALTLAGVTGIIVAIGVSVDSNVVYFEHLKEDIRDGRTARSSVDKAFPVAFSTIVKADMASLIGAGLLWWLTVGAVRGFALYLGLATLLDLVATYFFMGPMVRLMSRSRWFAEHPERFGLPASGAVSAVGRTI
ncbi:MAG: protein translocase subunit SecD [Acidimicrobiales bacterium]|jgi:preprotein translocase subunit SecD|nr:protein translocase subunit SecD [Acidimicrobiales bacterium]MDP6697252.1 protein translocase subunit SecD [Acidimicrobiales bacterium]|tara:strand:+ start:499 stop:1980 length:1482 start_codon:yes stop_codon:yes gene_type:complete